MNGGIPVKKLIFFLPALLFAAGYLLLAFCGAGMVSLRQVVWLALFLLSGYLLAKGEFWGSVAGLLPAMEFIIMSTRYTGQIASIELPLGIALAVFYAVCGIMVYRNN